LQKGGNIVTQTFSNTVVRMNDFSPEKYNILIPVTSMQVMSDMQRIIVNEVRLDATVDDRGVGRDIYLEKSSHKYAVTKVGGMKLSAAANISIISSESVKPDVCVKCIEMTRATGKAHPCGDCAHAYDVKYIVTIRVSGPSGEIRDIRKDKEIDCSLEKASMKPDQFRRFLPHRASIAESKALMRCIRDALGLAAGYTMEEIKKPFIIAHVVPNLDAPEIRNALANSYLQSMGLLFEMPTAPKQLAAGATLDIPDKADTPEPPVLPTLPEADNGYDGGDYPYEDDMPMPFDEQPEKIWCEGCGREIVEGLGNKGQMWTPEAIRGYSIKNFGRCLCPACQKTERTAKGGRR
jgi:hypothetical protein